MVRQCTGTHAGVKWRSWSKCLKTCEVRSGGQLWVEGAVLFPSRGRGNSRIKNKTNPKVKSRNTAKATPKPKASGLVLSCVSQRNYV